MKTNHLNYVEFLREKFQEKLTSNKNYSLRAFARDLKLAPSNLSQILNGKKGLSLTKAKELSLALNLSPIKKEIFCHLVNLKHARSSAERIKSQEFIHRLNSNIEQTNLEHENLYLEEERFKYIAQWKHYAILELIRLKNFKSDVKWMASKLDLHPMEVEDALERLEKLKFIKIKNKKIICQNIQLDTKGGNVSPSIRKLNHQLIGKALDSINGQDMSERHLSTLTIAASSETVAEIGEMIEKFKNDLRQKLNESQVINKPSEVYTLTMQYFRLTKKEIL